MREKTLVAKDAAGTEVEVPLTWVHTLVIGSGAAGLGAAVQLTDQGLDDVLIVTEGLDKGTSINTGSDKQTYYKLSMCGAHGDSPRLMAEDYFAGGGMHGDLAMVEASLSARAFLHLAQLGVPFPTDTYGQFVGYRTDHDLRQRATSIGPYTSREMCRALIREAGRKGIRIAEGRLVVALVTLGRGTEKRAAGAVALDADGGFEVYAAENVVFAVGGPGGLYETSVYPPAHTGAIGVALLAGAKAQGLPESQYGLASIRFRWNVSGTYMQVVPRFVSTAADGTSEARELLSEYFASAGEMCSTVFLKGYQWPFDPQKVVGGSSIVDILVYIETANRRRRVFLDFRENPRGFSFDDLSSQARTYLDNSGALLGTPIARLRKMNPGAVEIYRDHGIAIEKEPLEVAVCAQHNNGGLAANRWWESVNVRHLFPVGEVNGSHGVCRPGGSALNSGQVGGFRAAEFIAHRYRDWKLDEKLVQGAMREKLSCALAFRSKCESADRGWQEEREEFRARMTRAGAHVRSPWTLREAVAEARAQWERLRDRGCGCEGRDGPREVFTTRQLCFAHLVYLEAARFAVESGVGSRGSAMILSPEGRRVHEKLGPEWRFQPEDPSFRKKVLETVAEGGVVENEWVPRRPIPDSDAWFETAWAAYREGEIFG
jgi:succinate dehydrogenase/fumarate reductase flavoprotein subunit